MTKSNGNSKVPFGRKLIYLAVVLVGLFVPGTIVLNFLEDREVIDTQRPDDLVARPPVDMIEKQDDRIVFGDHNTLSGSVPAQKSPDVFRILCVGGSFMMGFPYAQPEGANPGEFSIPFWIEHELSWRLPKQKIEIINLAGLAQNSSRVLSIVKKSELLQPDLLIVATGNNEGNLAPTRFNDALHQWVLYRAMKKVLTRPTENAKRPMFTPQDADVEKIETQYQQNIVKLVDLCKSRKIPLVLATMPINLRYKDYVVDTHPGGAMEPTDDPGINKGLKLMQACRYQEAIDAFAKSEHPVYAMHYMGRCYQALKQYDRARELFKGAVQLNPLTRTKPTYNEFLRKLPPRDGLYLIDLEKGVEEKSVGGIPPEKFFLDYCHLAWWGNYMMARTFTDRLVLDVLPGDMTKDMGKAPSLEELISKNKLSSLYNLPESSEYMRFTRVWGKGNSSFPDQHQTHKKTEECNHWQWPK